MVILACEFRPEIHATNHHVLRRDPDGTKPMKAQPRKRLRKPRHFTFSILRSARPNRKISTPDISFWMTLAVETALGTMGTGFCPA